MDYLQYLITNLVLKSLVTGFKPCYKWITFNTKSMRPEDRKFYFSFKPCYKWITFNTEKGNEVEETIYSFKPCYKWITFNT